MTLTFEISQLKTHFLSVIIVTNNRPEKLYDCLNSVSQQQFDDYEIIVIDNHSHDHTDTMISNNYPDIIYIQNKNNLGFSKAANIGLKQAGGDYLCLLNPDTIVCHSTFSTLIDYLISNKNVGAVGPKILNTDGKFQLSSKRSFPNLLSS